MKSGVFFSVILLFGSMCICSAQGVTRYTYHDPQEKQHLKEVYQVKDTIQNILQGRYIAYFLNGKVESKGQFTNNETSGIWEFYFETGALKMRGILFKGANYGLWEYFYENGKKSMEGIINGKNREGEWKTFYENGQIKEVGEYKNNKRTGIWKSYFEDGVLKGTIDYTDDFGRYTEYYHSGKILAEGPRSGTKNTGHWRFYAEDGTLQSEGAYTNGKKDGNWTTYFPSGKISGSGKYENDQPMGTWVQMHENGKISSSGAYVSGEKDGSWKSYTADGKLKSEITLRDGTGEYIEYHGNGKIKLKGKIVNEKRQGKWEFYSAEGVREGVCEYHQDKGTYYGYFPNGNLRTKGTLEGELKTGTWEIYNAEGTLSGYYKPFYEDRKLADEIMTLAVKPASKKKSKKRYSSGYFRARNNEFKGVIASSNPIWLAAGRIPFAIEFYNQERLGHEFEFIGIRDPFFKSDADIAAGKKFKRGYSVAMKQKFYNPLRANMWYFGHEIRFTNLGHFVNQPLDLNPDNLFTFNAVEQRIQWGAILGYRIMRKNDAGGFTIDAFVGANFGYRGFDLQENYASFFNDLSQSRFATTYQVGLNLGNVFSFR
ncbi:MAG TPA: hypothetical protein VD884_06145 [Ohtaekwangia sp.]|nr:hypothetical protein [Ohtaekwangia sp.]